VGYASQARVDDERNCYHQGFRGVQKVMYRVFRRAWWKESSDSLFPRGLEPDPRAERTWIKDHEYEDELDARDACRELNKLPRTCEEERLSVKYEYTREHPSNW